MRLEKTFRFEAAHYLPHHKGKCQRLHGHSWVLHVFVEGPINDLTGMVVDYGDIKEAVQPYIDARFDHYFLNDLMPNPTSENVLLYIAMLIEQDTELPWSALSLEETCTASCYLTRKEYFDGQAERQDERNAETEKEEEITNDDIPF